MTYDTIHMTEDTLLLTDDWSSLPRTVVVATDETGRTTRGGATGTLGLWRKTGRRRRQVWCKFMAVVK